MGSFEWYDGFICALRHMCVMRESIKVERDPVVFLFLVRPLILKSRSEEVFNIDFFDDGSLHAE